MYPGARKMCGGDGCTAPIPVTDELCADCALKKAREDAARKLYASDGIRQLEHLLERHAEFEDLYGPE